MGRFSVHVPAFLSGTFRQLVWFLFLFYNSLSKARTGVGDGDYIYCIEGYKARANGYEEYLKIQQSDDSWWICDLVQLFASFGFSGTDTKSEQFSLSLVDYLYCI